MDTKQEITRRYFREFDSVRKIARDLQISRQTVRKILLAYAVSKEATDSGIVPVEAGSPDRVYDRVQLYPGQRVTQAGSLH